ncbi:glycogen synthase GlgA [Alteribacter natronophilus]|uniref:glycogen synthase GlgA n=1 Tax=Alteribacter natronophilus TaxID=2583810 RepID=UPI00110E1657|nr:glycogen synthase GlgA [Alteribacter natronophilus]TMW71777.1 glycogen synthase GlgA [Alteribacter natronophilus]
MKNVLFAASECTPFIKTGGLADVIGSLPQELNKSRKAHVKVILPFYDEMPSHWQAQMELVATINVPVGWRNQEASLYSLEHNNVEYFFVANDYYFTRKGVYGYYDDGERFVFFSRAVIEALPYIGFTPDVIHAHDWQTGLVPAFAKILQPLEDLHTVFTIHNIRYQGMMPHQMFDELFNLSIEHFGGLEWNGMLNCMKSGIFHADKITTVSPSYAEEIKDPYYGEGLHQLLNERAEDLSGIINGIDTNDYHPMKDPYIFSNYRHSRGKKKENKEYLQEQLHLPVDGEKPLYIIVSRLVEQKGFHLVQRILDEFLEEDVQVAVLGTGEGEFEGFFYHAQERHPDRFSVKLMFDEKLARQMYAAADFFIMPSQFEPCGLTQLIALQYKAVPIVRETGGLRDTVTPFNEITGEGNGFRFENYNAHELLDALRYSLSVYRNPIQWIQLLKNVNKSQYSWKDSAASYADLYESFTHASIYS